MRTTVATLVLSLLLIGTHTAAFAQEVEVVGPDEIEAALEAHHAHEEARRVAVERVLRHPEVRDVALTMGVDPERLEMAADVAEGEGLAAAAREARTIESQLAGGQSITISTTTLIIILLLVILVIVAD